MKTIIKEWKHNKCLAELVEIFKDEKDLAFLDSSLENEIGQYSILGLNPYLKLEVKNKILEVNGKPHEKDFLTYLGDYLKANSQQNTSALPFISGAIGYLSYEFGRSIEKIESRHERENEVPEVVFYFYDNYIVEELKTKKLYFIAHGKLESAKESIEKLEEKIKQYEGAQNKSPRNNLLSLSSDFTKQAYQQAIQNMIDYIVEGDIYIANMTRRLRVESEQTPYEMFRYLRSHNPSPFGGYLNYGEFQIISASPERFLKMEAGQINTRPMKGTRKRGQTALKDEALKKELQNSEKDQSELLMIVDLMRNDLNRVCEVGSVEVNELFTVETYATVFQLVANVQGRLRKDLTLADLLRATFPGGSITGAPKIRAMEVIDELEKSSRGIYTGSMGYISLDGSCDLNMMIRTALYQKGIYHIGVGGGITCESDLEFEYEETNQKAKALLEALGG